MNNELNSIFAGFQESGQFASSIHAFLIEA